MVEPQPSETADAKREALPLRLPLTPGARVATAPSIGRSASRARHLPLLVGLCLIGVAIDSALYLSTLSWVGPHRSPVALHILRVQIIGGATQLTIYVLAAASVAFFLARRPRRRRIIVGAAAIVGGVALGAGVLLFVNLTNVLGVALTATTATWVILGFAGTALGVASLWSARGWRAIGIAFGIIFILLAGTLGVNADFGLDPNIGALAGISTLKAITIPVVATPAITSSPAPIPPVRDGGALWANWVPPQHMPLAGSVGQVTIPGTISGFKARPAGLYLPPAALVKNPPALPLVIMMMGNPGNPDPSFQKHVLDALAAKHNGLAPIVIVADQLGNPSADPLCLNTANYGHAETYITQDVVNWARSNLHVLQDAAHWTIAGYSNGGECALYFGAKYPSTFGNVLDISGETFPGADKYAEVLSHVFHGNTAAYRGTWPINVLPHGRYPDTVAMFTAGSNDISFRNAAMRIDSETKAFGWKSTYLEIPNGGHGLRALDGGLSDGYSALYARLGLSK